MFLINKETIMTLIALYFFSNKMHKYHFALIFMKAYNFALKLMDYVNFVLTPEYFDQEKIDSKSIEDIEPTPEIKYENKYLEEFKKLNKEFILDENEAEIKKNKYMDFVTILNDNKVESYLNRLREVEEQLSKYEKSEEECCVSDIKCEDDSEDIEMVETKEERVKTLLKEKETILFDYNKQNEYLQTQKGKEEIMSEALTLATTFVINKRLEKLKNCYVMEKTPLGNVLMIYNIERGSFSYYSDSNMPYRYLETVARKYVKMFNCRPIFVDMDEELKNAEEKLELEKEKEKEKQEEINNLTQKVEQKKSVFAKFKSYNKDSSATKSMAAPPKNSIPNKRVTNEKENEKMLLKDRANRYTYEGKFANFNFLKKVDKKAVDKKYALTFADFKKMQINK